MCFAPGEEGSPIGAGEPLLVDPGIPGSHIGVDQRPPWIGRIAIAGSGEQLVHRQLPLSRLKAEQQRAGLSAAQGFTRCPLHKGRAEPITSELRATGVSAYILPGAFAGLPGEFGPLSVIRSGLLSRS